MSTFFFLAPHHLPSDLRSVDIQSGIDFCTIISTFFFLLLFFNFRKKESFHWKYYLKIITIIHCEILRYLFAFCRKIVIDWSIFASCQTVKNYFSNSGEGITSILSSYLHFYVVLVEFFYTVKSNMNYLWSVPFETPTQTNSSLKAICKNFHHPKMRNLQDSSFLVSGKLSVKIGIIDL